MFTRQYAGILVCVCLLVQPLTARQSAAAQLAERLFPSRIDADHPRKSAELPRGSAMNAAGTDSIGRRLPLSEIGQIVDAVLSELLPPESSLSRLTVAKRGLFLDVARTMEAFHVSGGNRISIADLGLRTAPKAGSRSLLDDCDQVGSKPCDQLGRSAYVLIEPIRVTTSQARVRAIVSWPDRGLSDLEAVAPPGTRVFLTGFSAEVDLVRAPGGRWRFQNLGKTIAHD